MLTVSLKLFLLWIPNTIVVYTNTTASLINMISVPKYERIFKHNGYIADKLKYYWEFYEKKPLGIMKLVDDWT